MSKVLTIIVSYNFEPWIHKCLQSLLNSSSATDIIVIDNASNDDTVSIIKAEYPAVLLVESKNNLGFGKANNIGMEYAIQNSYDFVFLVNQDAWIDIDCVKNLLLDTNSKLALLSPIHYDGTEKLLDKGFAHYCKEINLANNNSQKINFVNAAFWFIPIQIIKQVGLFSPVFYHYGEDKDFSNRLHYHGFDILIVNNAKAYHDRQNRKATQEVNFKSEFVFHLTEFCNINYSWSKAFAYAVIAPYKKSWKYILNGNFEAAENYIKIASKLWNKMSEVQDTRKKNKIIGYYFNS